MMFKTLAIATTALTISMGAAAAGDLQLPYPSNGGFGPYSWVGPYLGLNFGYQWGDASHSAAHPSGLLGGIQGGYNWEFNQFVAGVETDLQLSDADDTFAAYKFSNPWFGTARGRLGLALNNILFYATLGLAYGGGKVEFGGLSDSHVHLGWTAGGGIEVGLTRNWSVKTEYLYLDMADRQYSVFGITGPQSHLLRFGVNYRF